MQPVADLGMYPVVHGEKCLRTPGLKLAARTSKNEKYTSGRGTVMRFDTFGALKEIRTNNFVC